MSKYQTNIRTQKFDIYGWMSVLPLSLSLLFGEYNTLLLLRQRTRIKWIKKRGEKERKLTMTRRRKKERREETSRTEKRIRWLSIYVDQESNENSGSLLRFKLIQRERHTHTHTHRQLFCLCTVEIKRIQISYWYILFALNKMISKRKKTPTEAHFRNAMKSFAFKMT